MFLLCLSSTFSSSKTTCLGVLLLMTSAALVSPVHSSFQTMTDCYQFCTTLEHENAHWLWCLAQVCRSATETRQVPQHDKRGQAYTDDVNYRREIPPLLDLIHKRVKEFWEGPISTDAKY